jgi:hypothetical protein
VAVTVQRWRICKYDRSARDNAGRHLRDEWIGAAQIGEAFAGKILTRDEYLRVEQLYVAAVVHLWKASGSPSLQIQALEPSSSGFGLPPQLDDLRDVGFKEWSPINGEALPPTFLESMVRWCLRELGWCQLHAYEFYVHWGYDYYVYVGTRDGADAARKAIESTGLFVEPCESPYTAVPIRGFLVLGIPIDADVVDHQVALTELDAATVAELWPPVPALVGYRRRAIDPALAARILRYSDVTFDFDRFTYTLEIAG